MSIRTSTAVAIAVLALLVGGSRADRLPSHISGKKLYVSGTAASGSSVTAWVGETEVPAALLPCVNCHGADGRGKAEGGVVPSNLTWAELTKPYRTTTLNGRRRPPYTESSLARAITAGIDSAGNPLNNAMPRYRMSDEDLADLLMYLKLLGQAQTPGVGENSVRVATIIPRSGPGALIGRQMTSVLSAYFSEVGEIHGRGIDLDVIELTADPRSVGTEIEAAIAPNPPFALVGGLISGFDRPVEEAVERAEIPLVLPVSTHSDSTAANRQRFYLFPGVEEQLSGLLRFCTDPRHLGSSRLAVVAGGEENVALAQRAIARLENTPRIVIVDSARLDAQQRIGVEMKEAATIIFLDSNLSLRRIAELAGKHQPGPGLVFLSGFLPEDFFQAAGLVHNRLMVSLPNAPDDLSAAGLAEYRAFAARHSVEGSHLAAQISAYAAAKVLVHALKTSGRELTRESLRASLESLYRFETGITPPITFGRGRRIGATRIQVATLDPSTKRFKPLGEYRVDP